MTLAEQAYAALRWDIISGAFQPDQPLRLESLKQRYGIGFSPIREALNRLSAERLVTSASLRGFAVAPLSRAEMWDAINTRVFVETRALRLSINSGDDDWESRLVGCFHALARAARRCGDTPDDKVLRELEARHRAFHRALISACGSNWLLDFADKLYAETERYRLPSLAGIRDGGERDIHAEHRAILDATLERDTETATTLLEEHFLLTGRTLDSAFAGPAPNTATTPASA